MRRPLPRLALARAPLGVLAPLLLAGGAVAGSDGTLRGSGVLAVRERDSGGLLPGPFGRFIQRLLSFLRGYRYGESEVVVRLLDELLAPLADTVVELLAVTGALELYVAALGFRDLAREHGLEVSPPELLPAPAPGSARDLRLTH